MTGLSLFLSRYLFMGCLIWLFYFIFEKPMDALFTTAIRRGHIPGQDVLDEVNEEEKGKGKIERCFHHFPACVLGWPFVIAITVYSAYCWLTKSTVAESGMSENKTEVFNGFGFPLVLLDPPRGEFQGEPVLNLNYNKLQVQVMHELKQRGDYFGAELKFIRTTLEQTQEDFAETIGITLERLKEYETRDLEFCGLFENNIPHIWKMLVQYCDENLNPKTYKFLMTHPPEEQW